MCGQLTVADTQPDSYAFHAVHVICAACSTLMFYVFFYYWCRSYSFVLLLVPMNPLHFICLLTEVDDTH